MKLLIIALGMGLLLMGCSDAVVLTEKPLTKLDRQTSYAIEERDGGFYITVLQRVSQFFPEIGPVLEQCKSSITSIAYDYADNLDREIKPINPQRIRLTTGRNGFTATTSCSASVLVKWKK